jgi:hypothetical protein
MALFEAAVVSVRSPEIWAWLQIHCEELISAVPAGTRWALLSHDGHKLLGYGDDADRLRELASEGSEADAILLAVPKLPEGCCI